MPELSLSQAAKLTGKNGALAPVLANYEQLTLQREFAQTSYTSALTALENARLQAMRQQLFVVRVVEPNMPQRALFPHSTLMVVTVFLGLVLTYSIAWLIIAGMREHAAWLAAATTRREHARTSPVQLAPPVVASFARSAAGERIDSGRKPDPE